MSNISITQNSKEPKRNTCLDMCLCIDKVVTCVIKSKTIVLLYHLVIGYPKCITTYLQMLIYRH